MLALSPPLLSTQMGHFWPLDDAISYEHQNYFYSDINVVNSSAQTLGFLDHTSISPPSDYNNQPQVEFNCIGTQSTSSTPIRSSNLSTAVKKLNHNASERDRRKKINDIYTSLRALLPASDHTKKLSIPATVSYATKYIPQLQKQVEGLIRKKEELMSQINIKRRGNLPVKQENNDNRIKDVSRTSLSSVSASQLGSKEVSIQISTHKVEKMLLSEILHNLEKDGFSVLTASSFESIEERLFHNLHLQSEESCGVEYGTLSDKLMSLSSDNQELLIL